MRATFSLVLLLGIACARPRPLVICHNANCSGDPAPDRDDTIEGLRESLALGVDGVEIDFFWDRGACKYAHDEEDAPGKPPASAAVDEIVAWNATRTGPYVVVIELKPTGEPGALADCALLELDRLEPLGLTVRLDSQDPGVLGALAARRSALHLTADFSAPRPLLPYAEPISEFAGLPLSAVTLHPRWVTSEQVAAVGELDLELAFWTVLVTVETLDAIERWEPVLVTTGDAPFLRAWLEW